MVLRLELVSKGYHGIGGAVISLLAWGGAIIVSLIAWLMWALLA